MIVRWVGPDRVGAAEHAVLQWIRKMWQSINPLAGTELQKQAMPAVEDEETATVREGIVGGDAAHAAAAAKDGEASMMHPVLPAILCTR